MDIAPQSLAAPPVGGTDEPSPYQLLRKLGEGGYGQVFEAWDSQLRRRVAIKRLKQLRDPGHQHALLGEARAAASLRHSAFVKIYAFHTPTQSIVMELVEGHTLSQLLLGPAPTVPQALDLVRQVADAMQQAHQCGMVHGDLKPSNLMRDAAGNVRILDFGLARQIDPLATASVATDALQGTIAYLAPERLLGKAADPSSDIYALGVVLYQLLTGRRPLQDLSGLALAAAQLQTSSSQWPFPPEIEQRVIVLVRGMTASDPTTRLPTMEAVSTSARALLGVPAGANAQPAWVPLMHRLGAWRACLPTPRALLAALLAVLLAAALLASTSRQPAPPAVAPPMSTARAMHAGLEALRSADRDGALATAIGHFSAILKREPHHAGAEAGLSLAYSLRYFGDGRDEAWLARADAAAQQALQDGPELALAHAARAWVLEFQGHGDAALKEEQTALQLDPLDLFAQWGQIDLLITLGRFAQARQALDSAMAHHPDQRLLYDLSGRLHFKQGQYPAAEQDFRRSIALEPDLAYAYANLHAVLLRLGRADDGLRVLQQGLQVHASSRLYSSLGAALFARGDYVAAQKNFELAVSADRGSPNKYLYWANLADALRWIPGRAADSRHAYRQAVALLQPLAERISQDAAYQSRMGLYQAKLDEPTEAVRWTQRALRTAPDSADVHFRASLAFEITGDRSAALAQLKQAMALGYPVQLAATEPDLIGLRRDPRYHQFNNGK